ncbi:MAG: YraN family protein [Bacteroidales bacterium]|jgi:putative endonuclease|nr:YraN family protein [Bacteroidales bacterium]
MSNISLGKQGESIAKRYLISKGYKFITSNWRFGHKEIDIIFEVLNCIVFVEVKTRSDLYIDPDLCISDKKQKTLINAANSYINLYDIDKEVRFDVVLVGIKDNTVKINHIEDAFYPTL